MAYGESVTAMGRGKKENIIHKGENWVDLTCVPCEQGRYEWKEAALAGVSISFFFNGTEKKAKVIACQNNMITLMIDGSEKIISSTALTNIMMKRLMGICMSEYKYQVGEIVRLGNTDITILKQERSATNKKRAYEYCCNRCRQINHVEEYNIREKGCCPVCRGFRVVKGVNDIATNAPWMIPYFLDESLPYSCTVGSKTTFQAKCPECGRIKNKKMAIHTLYSAKSIGCTCGDGYSYPNKFMYSVLEQLLEQKQIKGFQNEFSPDWLQGRRYDFLVEFVETGKTITIVEMDGKLGHGNKMLDKRISREESLAIDRWKDEQALKHGMRMLRINAEKSDKDYLREKIVDSLGKICNVHQIDWVKADAFALSNLVKKVCDFYEENKPIGTDMVAKHFHISRSTIVDYLKRGEKNSGCEIDWEYSWQQKYRGARFEKEQRNKRLVEVCEYYEHHKPMLAIEVAKVFGYNVSTVLGYLEDGKRLGYSGYDKEYAHKRNVIQITGVNKRKKGKEVYCFSLDGNFVRKFASTKEAANEFGVSITAISNCCKNRGTSKGYILSYDKCL